MSEFFSRVLSHDCGAVWQFVKYGLIGVLSTVVQTAVFYLLAVTCLKCLKSDDWAVRLCNFPVANVSDSLRAKRFAVATAIGFTLANIFCWLMNRLFVFEPGLYSWHVEFLMFFASSAMSVGIALYLSWALIKYFSMMTTRAVFLEISVSLVFNFLIRKFLIFKG